jgi:hypothetical protein
MSRDPAGETLPLVLLARGAEGYFFAAAFVALLGFSAGFAFS